MMESDAADTAAVRALNVVELLEQVLINLDMKDLERSRRISRQWNTLITTSVNFHQTRFLSPIPITKTAHREKVRGAGLSSWRFAVGGGIVSSDPIWFDRIGSSKGGDLTADVKWDLVRAVSTLHPALNQAHGCRVLRDTASLALVIKLEQFKRWVASSRLDQVFPTQPPPKVIHIAFTRKMFEKCLTLGDILRHVEALKEQGVALILTEHEGDEITVHLSDIVLEDSRVLLRSRPAQPRGVDSSQVRAAENLKVEPASQRGCPLPKRQLNWTELEKGGYKRLARQ